jgi:hypothetical protein
MRIEHAGLDTGVGQRCQILRAIAIRIDDQDCRWVTAGVPGSL